MVTSALSMYIKGSGLREIHEVGSRQVFFRLILFDDALGLWFSCQSRVGSGVGRSKIQGV